MERRQLSKTKENDEFLEGEALFDRLIKPDVDDYKEETNQRVEDYLRKMEIAINMMTHKPRVKILRNCYLEQGVKKGQTTFICNYQMPNSTWSIPE